MLSFISFLEFGITDILDIAIVTLLLFALFRWLNGTAAIKIFIGILLFYLLWRIFMLFHMDLLSEILGKFLSVGVISVIVIFQPEIRKFFLFLGNNNFISNISWLKTTSNKFSQLQVENLVKACKNMSASYTGALIIITKENTLDEFVRTGEFINADISNELIETIFFKNTPLHDGALIIRNGKLLAARCILPVSQNEHIPSHLGLRHRASIGVTENSDCISLIVSEQTGHISYCMNGVIHENIDEKSLRELLKKEFIQAS